MQRRCRIRQQPRQQLRVVDPLAVLQADRAARQRREAAHRAQQPVRSLSPMAPMWRRNSGPPEQQVPAWVQLPTANPEPARRFSALHEMSAIRARLQARTQGPTAQDASPHASPQRGSAAPEPTAGQSVAAGEACAIETQNRSATPDAGQSVAARNEGDQDCEQAQERGLGNSAKMMTPFVTQQGQRAPGEAMSQATLTAYDTIDRALSGLMHFTCTIELADAAATDQAEGFQVQAVDEMNAVLQEVGRAISEARTGICFFHASNAEQFPGAANPPRDFLGSSSGTSESLCVWGRMCTHKSQPADTPYLAADPILVFAVVQGGRASGSSAASQARTQYAQDSALIDLQLSESVLEALRARLAVAQAALVESPSSRLGERITQSLHILLSLQDRAELALDIIWKGATINLM